MTATVNRKELLDAVNMAGKFTVGHAFKNVCVDFTDRKSVRAFSTIAACEVSLPSLSGECTAFEIEPKALAKVIGKSKSEWLSIAIVENYWLEITDNFGAKFNVVTTIDNDLPVVERILYPSHEFTVDYNHIESARRYRNSVDDHRTHVMVINLANGTIMSTNGDTLYCGNCPDIPADINININKDVFDRMPPKKENIPVAYHSDSNTFEISYKNIRIAGECIDCKFPDVSDIIKDQDGFYSITINPNDLKYAIDQTFGFIDTDYKGVVFNFFGDKLSITATNPMVGELSPFDVAYKNVIPIDKIEAAFNGDYILKALPCVKKDDLINILVKDDVSPAYFEYNGNMTIVMPMRI